MRRLALIALPLALAACQPGGPRTRAETETTVDGEAVTDIQLVDAWCRPTPNARDMTACYATLTAGVEDRLVDVISPRAAEAQLHAVSTEGGVMSMTEMSDGLALPAGQAVSLTPGGDHIMLLGVTVPLVEGDRVPLALTFQSGAQIAFEAPVRAAPPEGGSNHVSH